MIVDTFEARGEGEGGGNREPESSVGIISGLLCTSRHRSLT